MNASILGNIVERSRPSRLNLRTDIKVPRVLPLIDMLALSPYIQEKDADTGRISLAYSTIWSHCRCTAAKRCQPRMYSFQCSSSPGYALTDDSPMQTLNTTNLPHHLRAFSTRPYQSRYLS